MSGLHKVITILEEDECPQCKGYGNFITYHPTINKDEESMKIEVECENCGFMINLYSRIINTDIQTNITL